MDGHLRIYSNVCDACVIPGEKKRKAEDAHLVDEALSVTPDDIQAKTLTALLESNQKQGEAIETQRLAAERTANLEESKLELEHHKMMPQFAEGAEKFFAMQELKDFRKHRPMTFFDYRRRQTAQAGRVASRPTAPATDDTSESPVEATEASVVANP